MNLNDLLSRAMRLLSLRDHSEVELRRKLAAQPFAAKLKSVNQAKNSRYSASSDTSPPYRSFSTETAPEEPIDPVLIEQVIAYCYQHNWLDDQKFSAVYLQSRSRKGYGPQRIRAELLQKGVDKQQVQLVFEESDIDWAQQAKELAQRKFGDNLPTVWHEKAKLQRYLMYRGFFQEDIQSIYRDFE